MSTGKLPTKIPTTIADSEFFLHDNEHDIFIMSQGRQFPTHWRIEHKSDSAEKKALRHTMRCSEGRNE